MKLRKTRLITLLLLGAVAAFGTACKKKHGCTDPTAINYDPDADTDCCCAYETPTAADQVLLQGSITSDLALTSNNEYLIKGFVYVEDGATLTIEPGTLIRGDKATKGSLIIKRGGKIMANGTSSDPIVFTSNQEPGARDFGDWGGVIICGKATHNQPSDPTVEGGPDATYGGTDDDDNSGVFSYVRIEFAGIAFQPNQEINGLTLCSVGRGTRIDHVQISYSGDDSYEFFGGAVNCSNLVAFRGWDDDFDTDFGYHGNVQFCVGLRDPLVADQSSSNGFESDNDAAGDPFSPYTHGIFSNVSIYGPSTATTGTVHPLFKRAAHLRRNTQLNIFNSVLAGFPTGLLIDGGGAETNAQNNDLQVRNTIVAGCASSLEVAAGSSFDITAWFNTGGWGNSVLAAVSDLQLNTPFSLTSPNFIPNAGSPLLSGADFSNTALGDPHFQVVSYRGAFGDTDWTAGWCNFDPQNTAY